MKVQIRFNANESLYIRDPELSGIGKSIIKATVELIFEIGYEAFTFKKLSQKIDCTEATIYRYFANKHKLLLYILNWYWNYLFYLSQIHITTINNTREKLKMLLKIVTNNHREESSVIDFDLDKLYEIVVCESSKVYLVKEVDEINKENVFKPYKDFCAYMAQIILEHSPHYQYPRSLASTVIETAHDQQFFVLHLPKLTDIEQNDKKNYVHQFVEDLLFTFLKCK